MDNGVNQVGVLSILDEVSEPVQLISFYFIFAEKHEADWPRLRRGAIRN
jgi:hypothetical protein